MTTLHTVNKSPLSAPCLKECLRIASTGDAILLLEDGAYGADANFSHLFVNTKASLYVLQGDAKARGVDGRLNDTITEIDDAEFVNLVTMHDNSHSWY